LAAAYIVNRNGRAVSRLIAAVLTRELPISEVSLHRKGWFITSETTTVKLINPSTFFTLPVTNLLYIIYIKKDRIMSAELSTSTSTSASHPQLSQSQLKARPRSQSPDSAGKDVYLSLTPALEQMLPLLNFGYDDLRERMVSFSSRFTKFMEQSRKNSLETKNEFNKRIGEDKGISIFFLKKRKHSIMVVGRLAKSYF
jgi:hypothetical protein